MKTHSWRAIEEIARLEQRNEMRAGKFVSLVNTPSVKFLNSRDKKEFFSYLSKRGRWKWELQISFFVLIAILFMLRQNFTGAAISETSGINGSITIFFLSLTLGVVIFIAVRQLIERSLSQRFKEDINLFESRFAKRFKE